MHRSALATLIFAAIAAIFVFHPFSAAEFSLWDDDLHLTQNPYFHPVTLANVWHFWTTSYGQLYIPVTYTAWAGLISAVQIFNPNWSVANVTAPFFAANLTVHLLNSFLVYRLLRRFSKSELLAALCTLVFIFHPLQVESVAWASGFKELIWVTFALFGLQFHLEKKIGAAFLFFVLALLCKPTAVVLPGIFFACEWVLNGKIEFSRQKKIYAVALAILSVADLAFTKWEQPNLFIKDPPEIQFRVQVAFDAIGFYLRSFLWPHPLSPDYGRAPDWLETQMPTIEFFSGLIASLALAVVLFSKKSRRFWLVPASFFILPLAPVLGLVPFLFQNYSTVADRYLYFPMIGFAILVLRCAEKFPKAAVGGIIALSGAYVYASFEQSGVWKNNTGLFRHVLDVNPRSYMAENNLGIIANNRGDLDEALKHCQNSYASNPRNASAARNIGLLLVRLHRPQEAEVFYKALIARAPRFFDGHLGYGVLLMSLGRDQEALNELQTAISLNETDASVHYEIAHLLWRLGRHNDSVQNFSRAVELAPWDKSYQANYAAALQAVQSGKF